MKKFLFIAIAACEMLACTEQNVPDNGGESGSKDISCDVQTLKFASDVETTKSITLTASGEWSASTNVTWLTIDPTSGQGIAFVKVTCQTGDPAEGKIIFSTSKSSVQVTVYREGSYYPEGFWVSSTKQIVFSQGNLQYQPSTQKWKFAEHQYDIIGASNKDVINDSQSSGWMDIFAWGTSGYNNATPTGKEIYYCYYSLFSSDALKWEEKQSPIYDSNIAGTNYDWGVYNKITNGGNQAGIWRTLTNDEWDYLINDRPNARKLKGFATINGIKGVIFLPNGWQTPTGLNFTPYSYSINESTRYSDNIYDSTSWTKMEQAGAIFLPCSGSGSIYKKIYAYDASVIDYEVYYRSEEQVYYWTSTHSPYDKWKAFYMGDSRAMNQRLYGPVRLVKDVE